MSKRTEKYYCASPHCPGYPWLASEHPHPCPPSGVYVEKGGVHYWLNPDGSTGSRVPGPPVARQGPGKGATLEGPGVGVPDDRLADHFVIKTYGQAIVRNVKVPDLHAMGYDTPDDHWPADFVEWVGRVLDALYKVDQYWPAEYGEKPDDYPFHLSLDEMIIAVERWRDAVRRK